MKRVLHFFYIIFIVFFLTLVTQVGGLIYLLYRLLRKWLIRSEDRKGLWLKKIGLFSSLYLIICLGLLPPLARQFGRVPLPFFSSENIPLKPATIMTCLTNRHYVRPRLKTVALQTANQLRQKMPEFEMVYLDANFPFWNGFPLLPHRSHNDGKKLDLAFIYLQTDGQLTNGTPSFLGYGVCEEPKGNEMDQAKVCAKKGYWQYSLIQKMIFNPRRKQYIFDAQKTKIVIEALAKKKAIGKIFIEPHLKQRLGLAAYHKIRFHGCAAVRHDDHIHIQL